MAGPVLKITGIRLVVSNIDKTSKMTAYRAGRGLKLAAIHLQRKSLAIVPIWTGKLRGSWSIDSVGGTGFKTVLRVGYVGVEYSVYVHEDLTKAHGEAFNIKHADKIALAAELRKQRHKYWKSRTSFTSYYFNRRPDEQAKFLEKPLREERRKMQQILTRTMRLR